MVGSVTVTLRVPVAVAGGAPLATLADAEALRDKPAELSSKFRASRVFSSSRLSEQPAVAAENIAHTTRSRCEYAVRKPIAMIRLRSDRYLSD
jgi:hypothetical protein